MATNEKQENLFDEFDPVSTKSWEEAIKRDLKGADYNKKLVWRSVDGITVLPYYRHEDIEDLDIQDAMPGVYPFVRGTKPDSNTWLIRQDIDFQTVEKGVEKACFLINNGVQAIGFNFLNPVGTEELTELLGRLPLKDIEVTISGLDTRNVSEVLDFLSSHKGFMKTDLRIHWDWDPLGEFSMSGKLGDEDEIYSRMAALLEQTMQYPGVKIIAVHGNYFRQSGSKFVQELGFSLALANEYLAEMDDQGYTADETAASMVFNFAIGSNYFLELAKLRAARLLWSRIIETYPGSVTDSAKMYVHAETSTWNKTVYDSHVNLLRTTTEAMSAVLGGVDSLTVHPFDNAFKIPDAFSERLARNQQIILKEESNFDKVVDPGGGSYYIEKLTDSIASEAWKLFKEVEKRGGYTEAFLQGYIQNEITTSAQLRDENIALQKEVLLGTNQYPDNNEFLSPEADLSLVRTIVVDPTGADAHPLIPYRGAEGFENLRMATENAEKRPKVFLLTIGNSTMRQRRAGFAANFFGCAGYEILNNVGFNSIQDGIAAAVDASADIIVLCSSDKEYADFGPEAVKVNQGQAILVIAGYPREIIEHLRTEGITHFIHVGTNILDTLWKFHRELGLPSADLI